MVLSVKTNLASLGAQRRLQEGTARAGAIYERLSSGQRINRASDDASGLAVSASLDARARVYSQGIRNGNDALSALSIADAALENLSDVVSRLRELAQQGANGSYSYAQRRALNEEAQVLAKEYVRIAQSTSFNRMNILSGSLGSGLRTQLGFGVLGSINASIGGAIGTGTFGAALTIPGSAQAQDSADLDGDGDIDLIARAAGGIVVQLGNGDGTFTSGQTLSPSGPAFDSVLADFNNDGRLDILTSSTTSQVSLFLGNGNGTFQSATSFASNYGTLSTGDIDADGSLDFVIGDVSNGTMRVYYGSGNGSFASPLIISGAGQNYEGQALVDFNGDGLLDIVAARDNGANGDIAVFLGKSGRSFGAGSYYGSLGETGGALTPGDFNGDGVPDVVAWDADAQTYSVWLGSSSGSLTQTSQFFSESSNGPIFVGDINGDGHQDLLGELFISYGRGDGTFEEASVVNDASMGVLADLNGDGVLDTAGYDVHLASVKDGVAALLEFTLTSAADSGQALQLFSRTAENLVEQRGVVGSAQSRIAAALNALTSTRDNSAAASSRIKDADVASETAALLREQILQQSTAAVLAQANAQPRLVLQLLGA